MRIVAIGLGGAGCRIVDSLYSADRRGSRVACVQALAIDVTESTLKALKYLPDTNKLFFPEESAFSANSEPTDIPETIDIAEIINRIHNFESGETDAILICMGLGGSLTDIAPRIIAGLRSSVTESIFGLVTLPCLAEGERRSVRAADQIDLLLPLLDGMILFDNETWYKKIKKLKSEIAKKEVGFVQRLGLVKEETRISPEETTYNLLNEAIVRRISLILKAGEFTADGGIDMAEVVLDSGEVLNTMKGMGFITIGYAVERLPSNPLAFLSQFRPQGVFDEENKKRASRIVELAKQAIYHEVSTPCDMTSAHKALVLIAGPSHELSMKGFMTVRKWIDRSIAGLEMRSGDYPVMNTKNVAIIVMLSGLENIPRVSEIREIRDQHREWSERRVPAGQVIEQVPDYAGTGSLRDEMIVLPSKAQQISGSDRFRVEESERDTVYSGPAQEKIHIPKQYPVKADNRTISGEVHSDKIVEEEKLPISEPLEKSARHRVIVTEKRPTINHVEGKADTHTPSRAADKINTRPRLSQTTDKNTARQRIEIELQKQRLKAIGGSGKKPEIESPAPKPTSHEAEPRQPEVRVISSKSKTATSSGRDKEQEDNHKTVIISRRKVITRSSQETPNEGNAGEKSPPIAPHEETPESLPPQSYDEDSDLIEIRDTPYRAKDRVFEGRDIQKTPAVTAKDSALIHTKLRPKTSTPKEVHEDDDDRENDDTIEA